MLIANNIPDNNCPICSEPVNHYFQKKEFQYSICPECQYVFVNPRPTYEQLKEWYASNSSPRGINDAENLRLTLNNSIKNENSDIKKLSVKFKNLIPQQNLKLLDLASGYGIDCFLFRLYGFDVMGLDPDLNVAQMAEKYLGIPTIKSTFEEFNSDTKYDVIYMNQVFEHVNDINLWLQKFKKHLTEDGLLYINFPTLQSFWHKIIGIKDPYFKPPLHLNHFSKHAISQALKKHNYTVLDFHFSTYIPPEVLFKRIKLPNFLKKIIKTSMDISQSPFCQLANKLEKGIFIEIIAKANQHENI